MRTFSPSRVASKPSIRTSSSSRSTSLSLRGPPGLTLVESSSCIRGPVGGLGLMVSLDDADPASRIEGLGGAGTGLAAGSGLGATGFLAGTRAAGLGATCGLDVPAFAGASFATRVAEPRAGFEAFWARDARPRALAFCEARGAGPRARDGFFDGRLEELTPELSDLPDRARHGLQRYDGCGALRVRNPFWRRVRNSFRMHADHPIVNTALLDDQRSDRGVALETPRGHDLQPAGGHDVAAYEPRDRDPDASNVGLDVCIGADHEVTVRLDLAAEVAEQLPGAFQLELAREGILLGDRRRPGVQTEQVGPSVRARRNNRRIHPNLGHSKPPRPPSLPNERLPPVAA